MDLLVVVLESYKTNSSSLSGPTDKGVCPAISKPTITLPTVANLMLSAPQGDINHYP